MLAAGRVVTFRPWGTDGRASSMRAMARVPLPPAESMKLTALAEIASGGMGSVEMARVDSGRLAGQILAIKRLHSSIANDKTFVDMFLDEAWLTAAMKSPHVMGVVAHGTDDRGMFLAVELIEGVPLSRLLKESRVKREAFSEQTVACVMMQICDGLTEAHTLKGTDGKPLGIVHRDLTPGNVLVAFDGNVKIVDFGIAKAEERITHTRTGTMKGKPAYMSPEQAKGSKSLDLRADLFSLGVMMFELLAGRRPWTDKSAFDVIMSAALKPHPKIGDLRPGVSPVFGEIIDKCLAKKANERWNSAAEIRDRLLAWRKEQHFTSPDLEVVRDFVLRNSQAQIEWFRRARLGEFAKGDAQTFKELEEAIDEARKRSGEAPLSVAPPTSSARSAFDALTPSKAKLLVVDDAASPKTPQAGTPTTGLFGPVETASGMRPTPQAPTPGADPTPLSGAAPGKVTGAPGRIATTMPSLYEASRQAQSQRAQSQPPPATQPIPTEPLPHVHPGGGLGGTIALTDGEFEVEALAPRSGAFGPQSGLRKAENVGLGGTAFMEVSPLKGMKLPDPRIDSSESDMYATIRVPELSDRPIQEVESRSVVRPLGGLVMPEDDLALGATMRSDDAPPPVREALRSTPPPGKRTDPPPGQPAPGRAEETRATGWNLRNTRAPEPPPEAKGLSGTTVLILILVAFIAGGAIAAWVAKTYLVQGSAEEPARDVLRSCPQVASCDEHPAPSGARSVAAS